jgi:hypothetical protein
MPALSPSERLHSAGGGRTEPAVWVQDWEPRSPDVRPRQRDHKFKVGLGYIARGCLKKESKPGASGVHW